MGNRVNAHLRKLVESAAEQTYTQNTYDLEEGDFVTVYATVSNGNKTINAGDFATVIEIDGEAVTLESMADARIRVITEPSNCYRPN